MTSYFSALVDFVSAHPHYAYSAVFLLALSEAEGRRDIDYDGRQSLCRTTRLH
jgi:hypothetical protein